MAASPHLVRGMFFAYGLFRFVTVHGAARAVFSAPCEGASPPVNGPHLVRGMFFHHGIRARPYWALSSFDL